MFSHIQAPTPKISTISMILKLLFCLTLIQSLFQLGIQGLDVKTISYFISAYLYVNSWCSLSYFACIINQIFNLAIIWMLLLEMANKLQKGLYEVYLSSQGIYKMSSLIFCIVCIYFNLVGYQIYKQLAYEIHEYENKDKDKSNP